MEKQYPACAFMQGNTLQLFNELGLKYGYIIVEGGGTMLSTDLASARRALQNAVENDVISGDAAAQIEGQMKLSGMVKDKSALFAKIDKYQLSKGFKPALNFELCQESECIPLPHGGVMDAKGQQIVKMKTAWGAFSTVLNAVQEEKVGVLDAIHLLQQVSAAKLPADDDAAKAMFDALPEATKNAYAEQRKHAVEARINDMFQSMPPELRQMLGLSNFG